MDFDPDLHFLTRGYTQRVPPEYFADTDDSGITWQPDLESETTLPLAPGGGGLTTQLVVVAQGRERR